MVGRGALPVTQVAFADAAAYADWAGKRLPSEAEFEYAARAGLLDADFPWGGEERPGGRYLANYWQGHFPLRDAAADGFAGLSAIGAFPPNRYGLFDLAGNVREWCGDWYAADAYQISSPQDPRGPDDGRERVVRGGSWLSAAANGGGICVWRRDRLPPDWMDDQTGFRCAKAIDGRPQREPPGGRL